jgi:energy-coupling factor transporter transmembrane protein EcfT
MRRQIQNAIVILGLLSIALGIWTMLQIPTMILSPWYLVLIFLPIVLVVAFIIGYLLKVILNSAWHSTTFTAMVITVICLIFYGSQYRPGYKIVIPDQYVGEVQLLVSNEQENDFKVNEFGIGYINQQTYKNGFRPIVIKAGHDISDQISGYAQGSYATTLGNKLSFEYLSFEIPGKKNVSAMISYDSLLKMKAIDTTRLHRK